MRLVCGKGDKDDGKVLASDPYSEGLGELFLVVTDADDIRSASFDDVPRINGKVTGNRPVNEAR